jgi:hypothetical protein
MVGGGGSKNRTITENQGDNMTTTCKTFYDLERAALDAHRAGTTWGVFWPTVAGDVQRLPSDGQRRAYQHLMHLWASGDASGMEPPGTDPREHAQ